MKLTNKILAAFVLTVVTFAGYSQDKRTLKTKVADVLAFLPAEDNAQAERLFVELSNLGEAGMLMVTDQVQPNGNAEGIAYRFAVSLLTHYSTNALQKAEIEKVYLHALANAKDTEVKAYFMDNLRIIGSDVSVKPVAAFIADELLYNQAITTVQAIGSAAGRQALVTALQSPPPFAKARLIQALGELKEGPALSLITAAASSDVPAVKKQALWSIALLGDNSSSTLLMTQAKAVGFKNHPTEATNALIEYIHNLKDTKLILSLGKTILGNTTTPEQQHYRLAALEAVARANPAESVKVLVKEYSRADAGYRKEVLNIAAPLTSTANLKTWDKEYRKSTGEVQADILTMMSRYNRNEPFITTYLVPALSSPNASVRVAAAQEIAFNRDKKFASAILGYLARCTDDGEIASAKFATLQLIDKDNTTLVEKQIQIAPAKNKVVLLQILSERRAVSSFDTVFGLTVSTDAGTRSAALAALPNVTSGKNTAALLQKLGSETNSDDTKAIQAALIAGVDANTLASIKASGVVKIKLVPVYPYLGDKTQLDEVVSTFMSGTTAEKQIAFDALLSWQNSDAIRALLAICKDPSLSDFNAKAFSAGVKQIVASTWPDDEKLLLLKEFMTAASDKQTKIQVLRAAGSIRTFLSLVFVSGYLDDAEAGSAASRAAMQLSLPTADARPGMTGSFVRETLGKIEEKLIGEDSQYERIDVATYLGKLPFTRGYESIFNGKDLTGWHGLVENPILRSKMTPDILAKKQKEADAKVAANWSVKDGAILFSGDGANLCTVRPYGDFEMIVDWKISKNGDSGIYLRGSPQVQIWDIARTDDGAQVGSGGLYNNKAGRSAPLAVADNPIGEWNTFRIKMTGDKVTVYLNGVLVVDNVVMENFWDKNLPVFSTDAIELQAHGTNLAFRNLYVKELSAGSAALSEAESKTGFQLLFNGKDLNFWQGNKTEYVVEDNVIAVYPTKESHGNLATIKEYSDFILRFEFQLTPAANNGIGIHAPLEGDAAYVGKEVQVLDDTAPVFAKLEPWQYNGSVYGTIASKKGFLKPIGDWNHEEIEVKGDFFKVTLNGMVITEGDVKKLSKGGTPDHKDHPGLERHKGPLQFLGHGSVVRFRNIRIKEL